MQIAVLDDYQNIALTCPARAERAQLTVFDDHINELAALVARLRPFETPCITRERSPIKPRNINRAAKPEADHLHRSAQRLAGGKPKLPGRCVCTFGYP
jgi:hypothetical protein